MVKTKKHLFRSQIGNGIPDGHQRPLVLKRVQDGCGGEQDETERVRRDQ